ncbi:MAG: AI-2E family transporter [Chloroflexota bacterium]
MEAPAAPPASTSLPAPSRRVLVLLAGVGALGILLWLGRDVLAPFVVGLLFIYLLDPVVERLARVRIAGRRAPRSLVVLLVYVAVALALAELFLLLVGPLVEQVRAFAQDAPRYAEMLNERIGEAFAWWDRLALPADIREAVDEALRDLLASIGSLLPSVARPLFSSALGLVGSVFGYLIIPVWAFWILRDRPALARGFDRAVPLAWRADTRIVLGIVRRVFGSWIRAQVILGLVVGLGTFAGLLLLGAWVDPVFSRFAVLLAVIAGLLELLPVIGPIIAAVPAVLLGSTAGIPGIVAALVLYTVVQQLENNILVPKIQGDATDLHPAAVIFSLILGGAIAGLLGAILALPVAATLRSIYVYAFRRAAGMSPAVAATDVARAAADVGMADLEPLPATPGGADPAATREAAGAAGPAVAIGRPDARMDGADDGPGDRRPDGANDAPGPV